MTKKINKFINKLKLLYNKKIKKNKTKYTFKETTLFMIITFSFGLVLGGIIMFGKGPFAGRSSSLNEFIATYNEISSSYYKEVDDDALLEAGIKGMVSYLGDPYSSYMTKDVAEAFNDDIEGIYEGIGAEIKYENEKVFIGRVFEDSPAEKAGLKTDDELIKVEDKDIKGKALDEIANMVKGKKGTKISITILRDKKEMPLTIERDNVDSISVVSELILKDERKIGYIYISIFAANTFKQFEKELKKLEEKGIDSLIIDVRGNQGGYLTAVTDIISLFLEKGKIIYQLKTKDEIEKVYDKTDEKREYPIVMLVDSRSASASEVLTGSLKESYNATVVGTKTFGKGKVQKVSALTNGSLIKYTYQEWLTPDGNYIDGKGIIPDEEIKYVYDVKIDNQKEKAIETILSK